MSPVSGFREHSVCVSPPTPNAVPYFHNHPKKYTAATRTGRNGWRQIPISLLSPRKPQCVGDELPIKNWANTQEYDNDCGMLQSVSCCEKARAGAWVCPQGVYTRAEGLLSYFPGLCPYHLRFFFAAAAELGADCCCGGCGRCMRSGRGCGATCVDGASAAAKGWLCSTGMVRAVTLCMSRM